MKKTEMNEMKGYVKDKKSMESKEALQVEALRDFTIKSKMDNKRHSFNRRLMITVGIGLALWFYSIYGVLSL